MPPHFSAGWETAALSAVSAMGNGNEPLAVALDVAAHFYKIVADAEAGARRPELTAGWNNCWRMFRARRCRCPAP
jgi:hypothetical protein